MVRAIAWIGVALALVDSSSPVDARQASTMPSSFVKQQDAPDKRASDISPDIVIYGIPDGPYPVTVDEPSTFADLTVQARQSAADARFFSRCVTARERAALRDLVDGLPNRNVRAAALEHIIRNNVACYPKFDPLALWEPQYYGACNPRGEFQLIYNTERQVVGADPTHTLCQAFFDRGAIVEKILSLYAPDLSFTSADLFAPAVRQRLHAREDRFDKTRSPNERLYAKVCVCLVGIHPRLALAYPKTAADSDAETRLRNALIGTSPECAGGATRVSVDPSQFRVYLADAIYSWAVALKGTDSLVPAS